MTPSESPSAGQARCRERAGAGTDLVSLGDLTSATVPSMVERRAAACADFAWLKALFFSFT